ncbi:type II/IV secretion system protein [Candidatus Peregrinibacteria bacterium]|nr:type II/IV secretion system protein [Candidatus Peregrinibacteria bacterium]
MPIDYAKLDGETLLKTLEGEAVAKKVSDLHFAPEKESVRLEWRLHGILQKLADIPHGAYEAVIRRIKFLSKLKLNITNVPQDGQYTFNVTEKGSDSVEQIRSINVRVATLPTRLGEKFTLRLLDPKRGIISLQELGFPPEIAQKLHELINLPHGIILVTGPTGSGKTTTLYSLLSTIVGKERNIITLENPVEYEIKGIVQSEIDEPHGYTFASGLRSILRHDPDVILVGEIRDLETAQTAIDASLTGHLVLSTLHTNSSIEAVPRLLSMGVPPYTFAPALRAILAQRMVRTLKEENRKEGVTYDPGAQETYGGVTALPELFLLNNELRTMILMQEQQSVIEQKAREQGFISMRDWGEKFVAEHITSKEEIARVTM